MFFHCLPNRLEALELDFDGDYRRQGMHEGLVKFLWLQGRDLKRLHLNLNDCSELGDECLIELAQALPFRCLESLTFWIRRGPDIGGRGLGELSRCLLPLELKSLSLDVGRLSQPDWPDEDWHGDLAIDELLWNLWYQDLDFLELDVPRPGRALWAKARGLCSDLRFRRGLIVLRYPGKHLDDSVERLYWHGNRSKPMGGEGIGMGTFGKIGGS